jgi:hypothetical protein
MAIIVPFSETEPIVGTLVPDAEDATKGFAAEPPSPLDTFVALGAVTTTPLTAATPGLDAAVAQIIAADAINRYFHVRFACTFHATGNATFEKAWVMGTLAGAPNQPDAIALSLDPLRSDHPVDISQGFEIGIDFKFLSVKGTGDQKITAQSIFVEALNEGLNNPAWEFTQTASDRLSGLQRLQMIVRTGASGAHGKLTLMANIARNEGLLGGTYRARFGTQPEIDFNLT